MAVTTTINVSNSNSRDFDIDIPIIDREETIEAKVEEILFRQYIRPCQRMLDQHQKEFLQYISSLIRDGAEEILVDGQVIYMKH